MRDAGFTPDEPPIDEGAAPSAEPDCWFCPTSTVLQAFGEERFAALAALIEVQLVAMPASGIYSDELDLASLWEEYCYEAQEGPTDQLHDAWDATIHPYLCEAVDGLSHAEACLLTLAAADLGVVDGVSAGAVSSDLLHTAILERLSIAAHAHTLRAGEIY